VTTARVDVVQGPDLGSWLELPLGGRLVVGRGRDVDLKLTDTSVSRRHCALEHGLAGVRVVDLECKTGAVIEQEGKRGPAPALVTARARVALGETVLSIVRSQRGAPPPPEVPGLELLAPLGEGGSGTVYEGRLADGRAVAVKVMLAEADPIARARFEREATLATRLDHPGLVRIHDLRRATDGRPCLVRDLVRGRSLLERIERDGRVPWTEAATIGIGVAHALEHAHARGVIHRDVKPGNVMLQDDGAPRLIDFDLARRVQATAEQARATLARLTGTGEGLGSLAYVAPEQLQNARDADARADIYGLGLTLYHALTGVAPFADVEPDDFLDALLTRGPRPAAAIAPDLPRPLALVIARAHALAPEDRFPRAAELALALAACLAP
jgi:eukaryotic-like serine/threonine-protein kinase